MFKFIGILILQVTQSCPNLKNIKLLFENAFTFDYKRLKLSIILEGEDLENIKWLKKLLISS